jgi:hypothetical protein
MTWLPFFSIVAGNSALISGQQAVSLAYVFERETFSSALNSWASKTP